MSFEQADSDSAYTPPTWEQAGDDRAPLALAAGLVAGLVCGGIWALIVYFTGYELGIVAWGIGLLVGLSMATVTSSRSQQLAVAAAGFAVLGLLAGKAFIFMGSTGAVARDFAADQEVMKSAIAWQLYEAGELEPATLNDLDETLAAGDTLSDALWDTMRDEAGIRLAGMSGSEREAAALAAARSVMGNMGLVEGVRAQLSGFDLLWVLLAVGTAYRMMAPARQEETEPQPA